MRLNCFIAVLLLFATTVTGQTFVIGSLVKITDFGGLYSTLEWDADTEATLRASVGDELAESVIRASNENAWPTDIATLEGRMQNRSLMADYTAFYLTALDEYRVVLFIPEVENSSMPEGMQPVGDIYFIMTSSSIELSTALDEVPTGDFATQMDVIASDFKNDFLNIINEDEQEDMDDLITIYGSLVDLEGAYQLYFFEDLMSETTGFRASFPGDADPAVVQASYRELARKVEALSLPCCPLSKDEEKIEGNRFSQTFQFHDPEGNLDIDYQDMVIDVCTEQIEVFDDEGNLMSEWEPVIYIYKL